MSSKRNEMDLLDKQLGFSIAYRASLVPIAGSVNAALVLSQAIYQHNYWTKKRADKWWYCSDTKWENDTGLSTKQMQLVRTQLIRRNLIKVQKKGIPCTNHYKLMVKNLRAEMDKGISNQKVDMITKKLVSGQNRSQHFDNSDEELEQIKRQVNLIQIAETYEYTIVEKESNNKHTVMKNGINTLVIKNEGEHLIYFNRDDDSDKGTVIDFIQFRTGKNIGEIRKELRSQLHLNNPARLKPSCSPATLNNLESTDIPNNFRIKNANSISDHPYLTTRHIPKDIQKRYQGHILQSTDYHRNVVFPLINAQGICGTDNRNKDYKNIDGTKGIWSAKDSEPTGVVLAESPVDALSFIACNPQLKMNLISFCGALSDKQFDTIKKEVGKLPVCIATDNDKAGDLYTKKLIKLFPSAVISQPYEGGQDWNNVLENQVKNAL